MLLTLRVCIEYFFPFNGSLSCLEQRNRDKNRGFCVLVFRQGQQTKDSSHLISLTQITLKSLFRPQPVGMRSFYFMFTSADNP